MCVGISGIRVRGFFVLTGGLVFLVHFPGSGVGWFTTVTVGFEVKGLYFCGDSFVMAILGSYFFVRRFLTITFLRIVFFTMGFLTTDFVYLGGL